MKKQLIGVGGAAMMLMAASGVHAGQGCSSITDYSSAWSAESPGADSSDSTTVKMPWRISLDYSYNNANQLILGKNRQTSGIYSETWTPPAVSGSGLGVRNRYEKLVAGISYDYSKIITVGVSIPYVRNQRWEDHFNYSLYTSEGIGDITVFGKYWFKKEKDAFNTYIDLALGLPTGTSNEQFSYPATQSPATLTAAQLAPRSKASYIQPGLGQWVPIIALGFEKNVAERTSLYGRMQYSDPLGKNNIGYKSESNLVSNIGMAYTFEQSGTNVFGVSGQINYIYAQFRQDTRNGVAVSNTGGRWADFQPGAFYSPNGGITTFTASAPIGIYYNANFIQTYAPWSLNMGVSQRF